MSLDDNAPYWEKPAPRCPCGGSTTFWAHDWFGRCHKCGRMVGMDGQLHEGDHPADRIAALTREVTRLRRDRDKWAWVCRHAINEASLWRGWNDAQVIDYYSTHYDADVAQDEHE